LAISGASNAAAYGGWRKQVDGVAAGGWYRLTAHYALDGVGHEAYQVVARLDWRDAAGKRVGKPEYAVETKRLDAWRRTSIEAPAPEGAAAAVLELYLGHAPQGTVWWDEISFEAVGEPEPRLVRVAAVNLRPQRTGSAEASVSRFLQMIEGKVNSDVDVILLPEGITVVGSGKAYADVAETIPGPTTARLGKAARAKNSYLVAGLYERDGQAVYNTSVLIDRQGRLAGKYRKVYLPREEIEGGLTPGSDYPVFDTDFGKVGMMICWDIQYADPARALALRGAELLLTPIWGGDETLARARAIENHVYLATSGYDFPTYVMDPLGELLAVAAEDGSVAVATLNLNKRFPQPWLGEMRGRFFHELRLDVDAGPR
jgi:predicted amidohydrolase